MQEILTKGDNNFGDDKARPAAEPAGSAARRGCAARCLRQFWKARTAAQGAVPAAAGAVCGGAGLAEQGAHHGPGGASPPSCWACPTAAVLLCAVLRLHWASAGHSAGHAAWPEGAPAPGWAGGLPPACGAGHHPDERLPLHQVPVDRRLGLACGEPPPPKRSLLREAALRRLLGCAGYVQRVIPRVFSGKSVASEEQSSAAWLHEDTAGVAAFLIIIVFPSRNVVAARVKL